MIHDKHPPNIVHRIRTKAGVTQASLADKAGMSPLSVIRAEQGLHPTLSGALCSILSLLDPDQRLPSTIAQIYSQERSENINLFLKELTGQPDYVDTVRTALDYATDRYTPRFTIPSDVSGESSYRHPLYLTRTFIFSHYGLPTSAIKFCALTGTHPATISAIESGKYTLSDAPALVKILELLLFTPAQIDLLERMCDQCL